MALEFLLTLVIAAFVMILLMVLSVAVTMPFHGALGNSISAALTWLVSLRANYNPHGLSLESGATAEAGGGGQRVGPTLTTLFGTLKRTKRIEGWWGLYKGAVPNAVFMVLVSLASVIFIGSTSTRGPKGVYTVPEAGGFGMAVFTIILTVITLPMTILTNRCIITPYRLPFNAKAAARLILTPDEFAKPWSLYLSPGLLLSTGLHAAYVTLVAAGVKWVLVRRDDEGNISSYFLFGLFLIFQLLSAGLLTPLEVISTRLSVQRNSYSPYSVASQSESTVLPEGVTYIGESEDVIGLRPEESPYDGFVDAIKTIIDEEGLHTLWRGWWVTALGSVGSAI